MSQNAHGPKDGRRDISPVEQKVRQLVGDEAFEARWLELITLDTGRFTPTTLADIVSLEIATALQEERVDRCLQYLKDKEAAENSASA